MEQEEILTQLRAYVTDATALRPSDEELILAALRLSYQAQPEFIAEVLSQVARTRRRQRNELE